MSANHFLLFVFLATNAACSTSGRVVAGSTGAVRGTTGSASSSTSAGTTAGGTTASGTSGGQTTGAASSSGSTGVQNSGGPGVQAVAAMAFLDSIGVNAHLGQGVDAPVPSATALAYAGIRELRDDGKVGNLLSVSQQAGVRIDYLCNQGQTMPGDLAEVQILADAGALLSVEGPNEPNNQPVTYDGGTSGASFIPVAEYQRDLYAAVKADPGLRGIPVFASSEAGGSEPDNVGLQFITIPTDAGTLLPPGTVYADFANTHNYVCGHSSQLSDNLCTNATSPTLNGDWDGLYVEYGYTWNGHFPGYSNPQLLSLPRVTTETGWVTQGSGTPITEEQQARLFLNLYLASFKQGWSYMFVYMLRDDPVQGYWGLFDTSYTAKTSGTYLHNFTTILNDTGVGPLGKLDYAIPSEPATVHDLLLQKSSGSFELVVWDERPSGGTDDVTVSFGASQATVHVYDPTIGTPASQVLSAVSTVPLTLSDHPMVLEIP